MFSKIHKILLTAGNILQRRWVCSPRIVNADHLPARSVESEVNEFITKSLQDAFPVPVVSDEHVVDLETRKEYKDFWLLDPLNGDKEFAGRFGDFSISLALIRKDRPIFGIIYAPALDLMYYGAQSMGAFCFSKGKKRKIESLGYKSMIAMVSRNFSDDRVTQFFKNNGIENRLAIGGALKFCYLAEGHAQVYIRYVNAKEWAIGAGDLMLQEVGGTLISLESKSKLSYNNENMSVPPFIAVAKGIDVTRFLV